MGQTPLHIAALNGHSGCVNELLSAGVPPDTETMARVHRSRQRHRHHTLPCRAAEGLILKAPSPFAEADPLASDG